MITVRRICRSPKLSLFLKGRRFKLLKCLSCQIVFTEPFPRESLQRKINKELYGTSKVQKDYWQRLPELEKRVRKIVQEMKKFKTHGRILDIGCGFGLFLKIVREAGFKAYGVEIEEQAIITAKEKFNLKNIDQKKVEEIDFPEKYFDVITLFDVLEHLSQPEVMIKKIRNFLKPDGLLVIQSPNIESLMFKLTKDKWSWLLLPNHLYHFTPKTLVSLLKKSGYKIISLKTFPTHRSFNMLK